LTIFIVGRRKASPCRIPNWRGKAGSVQNEILPYLNPGRRHRGKTAFVEWSWRPRGRGAGRTNLTAHNVAPLPRFSNFMNTTWIFKGSGSESMGCRVGGQGCGPHLTQRDPDHSSRHAG
jgi:hypothetical protein